MTTVCRPFSERVPDPDRVISWVDHPLSPALARLERPLLALEPALSFDARGLTVVPSRDGLRWDWDGWASVTLRGPGPIRLDLYPDGPAAIRWAETPGWDWAEITPRDARGPGVTQRYIRPPGPLRAPIFGRSRTVATGELRVLALGYNGLTERDRLSASAKGTIALPPLAGFRGFLVAVEPAPPGRVLDATSAVGDDLRGPPSPQEWAKIIRMVEGRDTDSDPVPRRSRERLDALVTAATTLGFGDRAAVRSRVESGLSGLFRAVAVRACDPSARPGARPEPSDLEAGSFEDALIRRWPPLRAILGRPVRPEVLIWAIRHRDHPRLGEALAEAGGGDPARMAERLR